MDLTGKWKYEEEYLYGKAKGELLLRQEGNRLSGKIIFTDEMQGEPSYMLQEEISGWVEDKRVKIKAENYDIIYSEQDILYELDSWLGTLVDENTITGRSKDAQGVSGKFTFTRMKDEERIRIKHLQA